MTKRQYYRLSAIFAVITFCVMIGSIFVLPAKTVATRCTKTCSGTVTYRNNDNVTVEYDVNGREYKVRGIIKDPDIGEATVYVEPTQKGSTIDVRYNPNNPREAYVGERPTQDSVAIGVFAVVLAIPASASGICFRAGFRRRNDKERKER